MFHAKLVLTASLLWLSLLAGARAAIPVHVVVGPKAPAIEQLAAVELARQWSRLFDDVDVTISREVPKAAKHVVFIGSPETNPAVKSALGDKWPFNPLYWYRDLTDTGTIGRLHS